MDRPIGPNDPRPNIQIPRTPPAAAGVPVFIDSVVQGHNYVAQSALSSQYDPVVVREILGEASENDIENAAMNLIKSSGLEEMCKDLQNDSYESALYDHVLATLPFNTKTPRNSLERNILVQMPFEPVINSLQASCRQLSIDPFDPVVNRVIIEIANNTRERVFRIFLCKMYALSHTTNPSTWDTTEELISNLNTEACKRLDPRETVEQHQDIALNTLKIKNFRDIEIKALDDQFKTILNSEETCIAYHNAFLAFQKQIYKSIQVTTTIIESCMLSLGRGAFSETGVDHITRSIHDRLRMLPEYTSLNPYLDLILASQFEATATILKNRLITIFIMIFANEECPLKLTEEDKKILNKYDIPSQVILIYQLRREIGIKSNEEIIEILKKSIHDSNKTLQTSLADKRKRFRKEN